MVDGRQVQVPDDGTTLPDALRDGLGLRSPKDGCSPQGQCGCCTVLVDGAPRVACVTPARRVAGRSITTLDGLPEATQRLWADAFVATWVPKILAAPAYAQDGLLIVTFAGDATPATGADAPVRNGALLVSRFAKAGATVQNLCMLVKLSAIAAISSTP